MADSSFRELTSLDDWNDARAASHDHPILIFKHSNACPTSAQANGEMQTLATESDVPVYRVVVQTHRPVSNAIAEDLKVRHETPQAIVLDEGAPAFDASHFSVTAEAIRDVLSTPHS